MRYYRERDGYAFRLALMLVMGLVTFYIHSFFNGFIESDKMAMPVLACFSALVAMHIQTKQKPEATGSFVSKSG